ncbi:MAG: hypothetical protein H7263_09535, partial [Candidatus Sericytochromatia bacterium]|nr:hypothetical protein [Candidatus Sericytochromatia bacterium]
MIIAGDSNTSIFSNGCVLPDKNNEDVKVQWFGPLNSDFFIDQHPLTIKLIESFNSETDWKILSIGTFEVFKLLNEIKSGKDKSELLKKTAHFYARTFSQLNAKGKFAWMVGMQQTKYDFYDYNLSLSLKKSIEYSHDQKLPLINLANEFNQIISNVCHKLNIPIINPMYKMTDQNGIFKEEYLSEDKIHISPLYDHFYYDEIKKKLGITLVRKTDIKLDQFEHEYHSIASNVAMY